MEKQDKIKYSIVIPTFNRTGSLKDCLLSISKQTISKNNFEIIVVDDGSTDSTKKDIEKIKKELLPNIFYIYQENKGCASARNTGIKAATGSIIFFTDDDCVVPVYWMEKLLKGFEKYPQTCGVGGWYSATEEELRTNKFAQIFNARIRQHSGNYEDYTVLSNSTGVSLCWNTANVAYKKEVFEKVGLFDTYTKKTAMVDYELRMRILYSGLYLYYIPLIITHNKKINFKEFINTSFRYGMSDYYLSTKFPEVEKPYEITNFLKYLYDIKNTNRTISSFYYSLYMFIRIFGTHYAKFKEVRSETRFPWKKVHRTRLQEFLKS